MIVIKLNPSQELRLRKSVQCNAEFANAKGFEGGTVPQPQDFEGGRVFATPLLCPIVNFSREEFLSIKKFSIYKMQNADGVYFFPCLLEMPQRTERAVFLCGVEFANDKGFEGSDVQQPQGVESAAGGTQSNEGFRFSLEDFINKAGGIITAAPENFWSEENFFFNATSFKMCQMEIIGNSYKLYDEVWKKI